MADSTASARAGWVGLRGLFGRNVAWEHPQLPGLQVRHCGHPTALRPYYVRAADGTISERKFSRLALAQAAAFEAALAQ